MSIEVKNYVRNSDENSSIVGFVSFYIPEWHLHLNDCRYIRNKNGDFFIGFPSKKVGEEESKYIPYYFFEGSARTRFLEAAKKAVENYIDKINTENLSEKDDSFDLF